MHGARMRTAVVELVNYSVWTDWTEDDVRDYARDLTDFHSLDESEASHLERVMLQQARHWPKLSRPFGPRIASAELVELVISRAEMATANNVLSDAERAAMVWEENYRLNRPYQGPPLISAEKAYRVWSEGDGLTKRTFRELIAPWYRGRFSRHSAASRHMFFIKKKGIERDMERLLWRGGYLEISHGQWLCPKGAHDPHEGLMWYVQEIGERLRLAERRTKQKLIAEAMCMALEAGQLLGEMDVKAAHDDFFKKAQLTRQAQSEGGKSNKNKGRDDNKARELWWVYVRQGFPKTEAGWQAAKDLKCSEPTIRRAFGGSYPSV